MALLSGPSQTSSLRSEFLLAIANAKQETLERYEILEKRLCAIEEKFPGPSEVGELQQQLGHIQQRLLILEGSSQTRLSSGDVAIMPVVADAGRVQATGGSDGQIHTENGEFGGTAIDGADENGDSNSSGLSGPSCEWAVSESIWDAAIYIGLPQLGGAASVFTAGLLLLNIALQTAFCMIVIFNFLEFQFSPRDLQGLRAWRTNIGHADRFVDRISQRSLVDRLCAGDASLELSNEQAVKLSLVREYLPRLDPSTNNSFKKHFDGPVMCILSLMIWYLAIAKELGSIFNVVRAVVFLPTTTTQLDTEDEGTIRFKTMSMTHKLLILAFNFARFSIAIILLVTGSLYLAYTSSMEDLLLNAVALEFIMTIDELIFEALAPDRLRDLVAATAPFQMRPLRRRYGLEVKAVVILVASVSALSLVWATSIKSAISNLEQASEELCGGKLDFAYKTDALGMVHIEELHRLDKSGQEVEELSKQAIREVISGTPSSKWQYSLLSGATGVHAYDTVEEQAAAIYEHRDAGCHDALTKTPYKPTSTPGYNSPWWDLHVLNNQWSVWPSYLQARFGGSSCTELASKCGFQTVKVLCPVTCYCNSLMGGDWLAIGCPSVCLRAQHAMERESSLACNEDASLQNNPVFHRWVKSIPELGQFGSDQNCTMLVKNIPQVCLPVDQESLLFAWEAGAGAHYKIVSYLCPVACNCRWAAEGTVSCPASCSCPCSTTDEEPASCELPLDVIYPGAVARLGVTTTCCTLLKKLIEAYAGGDPRLLETSARCLCKSCHLLCVDAFWAAAVSLPTNMTIGTVGVLLAEHPNQTASQRLGCSSL